jgi:hypothetical protein
MLEDQRQQLRDVHLYKQAGQCQLQRWSVKTDPGAVLLDKGTATQPWELEIAFFSYGNRALD